MASVADLLVRIKADSKQFIGGMAASQTSLTKFSRAAKLGAIGAGVAIAGIGFASIKMANTVDKSLREVQTLLPGLSDEGFNKLRDDVRAFSDEVGISQRDVVPALYQAISAGVPRNNVFEFMQGAADLSIGGVTDLTTATDLLSSATNAFAKEGMTTAEISDSFFTAVRLGKTTVGELASSFSTAAPLASALGISMDEMLASVTAITLQGAPTAEAFTQVRAAILSLERATPPMAKALKAAGFASGQAALDALGLQGALELVRNAADETGTPLIKFTGRAEGMQGILALTGDNATRAADALAEFGDNTGDSAAAVDTMNQSFSRTLQQVKVMIENALIPLGNVLLEKIQPGLQWIIDNKAGIVKAFEDIGNVVADVVTVSFEALSDTIDVLKDKFGDVDSAGDALTTTLKVAFVDTVSDAGTAVKKLTRGLFELNNQTNDTRIGLDFFNNIERESIDLGQKLEDTLLREGVAFNAAQRAGENAQRALDQYSAAAAAAQAGTESFTGAQLGAAEAIRLTRDELLGASAASLALRVMTDDAFTFADAMQAARDAIPVRGLAAQLENLLGPAFQQNVSDLSGIGLGFREAKDGADQFTNGVDRALGVTKSLGSAVGGLTQEAERLGEFFDTKMIVTWANIQNAILDAERGTNDLSGALRAEVDAHNAAAEAAKAAADAKIAAQARVTAALLAARAAAGVRGSAGGGVNARGQALASFDAGTFGGTFADQGSIEANIALVQGIIDRRGGSGTAIQNDGTIIINSTSPDDVAAVLDSD